MFRRPVLHLLDALLLVHLDVCEGVQVALKMGATVDLPELLWQVSVVVGRARLVLVLVHLLRLVLL